MEFRNAQERRRVFLDCSISGPSLTKQSFKDSCDVNKILKRYERTGVLDFINDCKAQYLEVCNIGDFKESCDMVLKAENMFASLPSHIRKRFRNDPGDFLSFMSDPSNEDEIVELGLAKLRPEASGVTASPPADSQSEDSQDGLNDDAKASK